MRSNVVQIKLCSQIETSRSRERPHEHLRADIQLRAYTRYAGRCPHDSYVQKLVVSIALSTSTCSLYGEYAEVDSALRKLGPRFGSERTKSWGWCGEIRFHMHPHRRAGTKGYLRCSPHSCQTRPQEARTTATLSLHLILTLMEAQYLSNFHLSFTDRSHPPIR